jgi:hypothetical protein
MTSNSWLGAAFQRADNYGRGCRASNRLSHKRPNKIARSQNRPRKEAPSYREDRAAYRTGGGDGPVGELGRPYAHERSYGQRGFWDWSRRLPAHNYRAASVHDRRGRSRYRIPDRPLRPPWRLLECSMPLLRASCGLDVHGLPQPHRKLRLLVRCGNADGAIRLGAIQGIKWPIS